MSNRWCFSFAVILLVITLQYNDVLSSPLKVVNGTNAKLGDAPYMVELRKQNGDFACGGSIVAPDWILTAGHCLVAGVPHGIVYGSLQLFEGQDPWPENSVLVKRGMQHPKYVKSVELNDIALLQLEHPIPFSNTVQPVQLPDSDNVPFHVNGLLTGWGAPSEDGHSMPDLQKLSLPLLSDEECAKRLNNPDKFKPSICVCSENRQNNRNIGTCYGDSGGPYVINGVQYGVVSWGNSPCGSLPAAYARVSSPEILKWIKKTIKS